MQTLIFLTMLLAGTKLMPYVDTGAFYTLLVARPSVSAVQPEAPKPSGQAVGTPKAAADKAAPQVIYVYQYYFVQPQQSAPDYSDAYYNPVFKGADAQHYVVWPQYIRYGEFWPQPIE